jgi:hypothetical protein
MTRTPHSDPAVHKPFLFTYELSASTTLNYDAFRTAQRISNMVLALLQTMDGLRLKDIAITRWDGALGGKGGIVGEILYMQDDAWWIDGSHDESTPLSGPLLLILLVIPPPHIPQPIRQCQPRSPPARGRAGARADRRRLLPGGRLGLRAPV